MNQLSIEKRALMLRCFAECVGVRAVGRIADVAYLSALNFNINLGRACEAFFAQTFKDLPITHLEMDETWCFVGTKDPKKIPDDKIGVWNAYMLLWLCVDPKTRLMPVWHLGGREYSDASTFMQRVKYVVRDSGERLQLASDGNNLYAPAIAEMFGTDADYMRFVKVFHGQEGAKEGERLPDYVRYSMPKLRASKRTVMSGNPDPDMSTNHIERCNLSLRMRCKRYSRLTNHFSRKIENHRLTIAMQMMLYNFCTVHGAIRCTPAMEAGITDHIWTPEEVVALMDVYQQPEQSAA
ncbi:MAG TPA: hypothetical protein VHD32_13555 [Candidatus Didemnitutus sp.]|nr:hypothetical protein [Candidatus Didemnitutus sp.]